MNPLLFSTLIFLLFAGVFRDRRPDFKETFYWRDVRHLERDDDSVSPEIAVEGGIPIGSYTFNRVYVSTNGLITVDGETDENSPVPVRDISGDYDFPVIAVFWTDLDPEEYGDVYVKVYKEGPDSDEDELRRASRIVRYLDRRRRFSATWMLVATWDIIPYHCCEEEEVVTVQGILITDGESTYTMFNYVDVETLVKDEEIAIGWATNETYVEHPISMTDAAFNMSSEPSNTRDPEKLGFLFYQLAPLNLP